MQIFGLPRRLLIACLAAGAGVLAGCSGPTEDVRVSLCKNLTTALQADARSIEWQGNENSFYRPEYAVTALTFDVVDGHGRRTAMRSACHYEHEVLDETAITLADPLSAYATLPFKMTLNGQALADADLLQLVNAEQRRLGRKVVDSLKQAAGAMADTVRGGAGQ